ncbi:carbohydrate phosphatase [Thermothelomyces heterothallicus CBS 203.75]
MTVSSLTHPPFAHELLIAQLAVQRAALVTKRILASVNAAARITASPPTLSPSSSDLDTCASPASSPGDHTTTTRSSSVSQYLHPTTASSSSYFPASTAPWTPLSPHSPPTSPPPPAAAGDPQQPHEHHHQPLQNSAAGEAKAKASANEPPRRLSVAKRDASPVTVADLAAQALLVAALRAAFPGDAVLGEEDASALRADPLLAARVWDLVDAARLDDEASERLLGPRPRDLAEMMALIEFGAGEGGGEGGSGGGGGGGAMSAKEALAAGRRVWCLDPIDGTSAYMQGGQYAISLALLDGGREVVGVLGCPNWRFEEGLPAGQWRVREHAVDEDGMGLMLSAVRGQGATVRPMGPGVLREGRRVDRGRGKAVDLRDVHFVDSERSPATLTEKVRELARLAGASYRGTNLYSSHVRYAAVVLGGREFVQLRWPKPEKGPWSIWDHAGSQLIYTESGAGKVTDLYGKPIDFTAGSKLSNNRGLITADESIHDQILALVDRMRNAEV